MSNAQKDWEEGLKHESRQELIKLVKHFQGVALGNYDGSAQEKYLLGRAVDKFTEAAELINNGGVIETTDGNTPEFNRKVPLSDFILGWGSKYTPDNIRFSGANKEDNNDSKKKE